MTKNLYFLEAEDGTYRLSTRDKVNALIEKGEAEWVGSDPDEDHNAVIHYADRIKP